jgi:hypothetical protein
MPYRPFPEGGSDDHLRLSTHSRSLRWSWPVMRGRPEDFWHKQLAAKEPAALLASVAPTGFAGVCVDRKMCADMGRNDEAGLTALLGPPSLVSPNGRYAYFDLADYTRNQRAQYTSEEWERRCEAERRPVVGLFGRGFMQTFELMPKDGRWCGAKGELVLHNFADVPRKVTLRLKCRTGFPAPSTLTLEGAVEGRVSVSDGDGEFEQVVTVGPGRNVVRVRCDAPPFNGQSRRIFRVIDLRLEPADEPRPVAAK